MLRLIRNFIVRLRTPAPKSPEQELDDFLRSLRVASKDGLAGVLAGALLAKKTLDTTRQVDIPFPADVLDGRVPLDERARADLRAYADALRRFQRICAASGSILIVAVAKGLDTWIATINAVADPALLDKGREAWGLLVQGEGGVEAAYRFMVRRDMTDVERSYIGYRPALLVPRAA
jgi:hypothetical protein